jgi:RNA polymerase sigma-70 factor (ECF subfamily)
VRYTVAVPLEGTALAELVRRAQAGDAAARDGLLAELYGVVRKQVFFMIGGAGRSLAEDAVQETMIALARGLAGFRGEASPRTWAIAIAMRTARRVRRREARHQPAEMTVEPSGFDVDAAAAAELVLLRKALDRLAPKKRDAFVLIAILELTAAEAARALGTFENTAASRYRHARAELEELLRDSFDGDAAVAATNSKSGTP